MVLIDTRQKKKKKEKTKGDNHHNINVSIQWVKNPNIDIHVVKLLPIQACLHSHKFSKK